MPTPLDNLTDKELRALIHQAADNIAQDAIKCSRHELDLVRKHPQAPIALIALHELKKTPDQSDTA